MDDMSQVSKGLGIGGLWGNGSIGDHVSHPFVLSVKLTKHFMNKALMEEREKGGYLLLDLATTNTQLDQLEEEVQCHVHDLSIALLFTYSKMWLCSALNVLFTLNLMYDQTISHVPQSHFFLLPLLPPPWIGQSSEMRDIWNRLTRAKKVMMVLRSATIFPQNLTLKLIVTIYPPTSLFNQLLIFTSCEIEQHTKNPHHPELMFPTCSTQSQMPHDRVFSAHVVMAGDWPNWQGEVARDREWPVQNSTWLTKHICLTIFPTNDTPAANTPVLVPTDLQPTATKCIPDYIVKHFKDEAKKELCQYFMME
ncbi:hypothetical protein BKA82DRAFT_4009726 [Pisolithus tinctorius]|nr:hypothetical protein BKA82DRAFT_4009726 [Pisolithus tinctorius]